MKNKITLLLILILLIFQYANGQQITFTYVCESHNDMNVRDIIENTNRSIYIVGEYSKPTSYKYSSYILKLHASGLFTDSVHISNPDYSYLFNNILPDSNNQFILSGSKFDTIGEYNNFSIVLNKFDTNLSILEQKEYNFPPDYSLFIQTLRPGLNNKLLITGTIEALHGDKMFLYLFNQNLDSLKAKIFLNMPPGLFAYDVKELNNGSFWILRGLVPYYALIDSNLNMISADTGYIPHWINSNYGLKWDTDTSFYLAGDYFAGFSKNKTNLPVSSIPNFTQNQLKGTKVTDHDIGFARQYHPFDTTGYLFNSIGARDTFDFPAAWGALDYKNKDSIFIGSTKAASWVNPEFGPNSSWYRLIQTDSMLNIRWEHFYGGDAYYFMKKVVATQDGGCIMAGTRFDYIAHPNLHKRDIYIIKVNSNGLLTTTDGKPSPIVHNAIVFPNPGNEVLRVRVAVQYPQSLLRLFDMNGRLVVKKKIQGTSATINTAFLPKGTYIYTITGEKGLHENGKWVKK